jgi:hypothetical protein
MIVDVDVEQVVAKPRKPFRRFFNGGTTSSFLLI